MRVELHIEELVLHGLPPGQRQRIGAAVRSELARLLAERGTPPSLGRQGAVARLDGGSFELRPGAKPETVGAQVAAAAYRGLNR